MLLLSGRVMMPLALMLAAAALRMPRVRALLAAVSAVRPRRMLAPLLPARLPAARPLLVPPLLPLALLLAPLRPGLRLLLPALMPRSLLMQPRRLVPRAALVALGRLRLRFGDRELRRAGLRLAEVFPGRPCTFAGIFSMMK
ncbi:hypothetical protein LJK88_07200 [Paenibacillus sp. P26]|nr:hypothetical protein LJK88_07200 [Paenibacillus sp. P26]